MGSEFRASAWNSRAQLPSFEILEKEIGTPCFPSVIAKIEKLPKS